MRALLPTKYTTLHRMKAPRMGMADGPDLGQMQKCAASQRRRSGAATSKPAFLWRPENEFMFSTFKPTEGAQSPTVAGRPWKDSACVCNVTSMISPGVLGRKNFLGRTSSLRRPFSTGTPRVGWMEVGRWPRSLLLLFSRGRATFFSFTSVDNIVSISIMVQCASCM